MSESSEFQEKQLAVMAKMEKYLAANGHSDKGDVPLNPRTMWVGKKEKISQSEAFAEFIMNVFDLSILEPTRKINMCMSAVEKPKNTIVALNFWDDGPGLPTGSTSFNEIYMQLNSTNKADNNKKTIGNAGIGSKMAAAKLGSHWHFSWSEGNGHPMCHWIADEDTWHSWHDYDYYEEKDYKGPSFFNLEITKLNHGVAASTIRDSLEKKFAGALQRQPNVFLYTCRPEAIHKSTPLAPPPGEKYKDTHSWSDTVYYSGLPIQASIGLLDDGDDAYSTNPSVRVSRQGMMHFDAKQSDAHKILFSTVDGKPLNYSHPRYRNILITLDSMHFESARIKNDLDWDEEINKGIITAVARDPGFVSMMNKISQTNINKTNNEESRVITQSYKEKIDKLEVAAADDINKMISDNIITNFEYPLVSSNGNSIAPKKEKRKGNATKTSSKQKNKKKQPSVKVGGKDYKFKIEWVKEAVGLEQRRSWLEKTSDAVIININQTYAGYTDKIEKDEKKEAVYLADTIGHTWQDYRFELLINNGSNITGDIINEIQRDRDDAIARYMPIIVG